MIRSSASYLQAGWTTQTHCWRIAGPDLANLIGPKCFVVIGEDLALLSKRSLLPENQIKTYLEDIIHTIDTIDTG